VGGPGDGRIQADLLEAGARSAGEVADELIGYLEAAQQSLDVAIYDFQASVGETSRVAAALEAVARRGVVVRVAINEDRPDHPAQPRPPRCDAEEVLGLEVPTRGVHGQRSLMHHKYAVRDRSSVWTGSLNWTDDAFALEENIVLRLDSPEIAASFAQDFEQLWSRGTVEGTGLAGPRAHVDGAMVRSLFSPKGPSQGDLVVERLIGARRRIRILSPVVTAGAIVGTLAEFAGRASFDLTGAYDRTQMDQVQAQWADIPENRWKIEAWRVVASRLSGKRSVPYHRGSVHDYMHAKAVVVDDTVLTGSYNLSRHGEDNAENLVVIESSEVADRFAGYAEHIAERYAEARRKT
jgi:phosphatidylserine/phosphatidylglycerophosphate/cardiolipin synthase-like enzyme